MEKRNDRQTHLHITDNKETKHKKHTDKDNDRSKRYRIKVQVKPKLGKIFAIRFLCVLMTFGILATAITAYSAYEYHRFVVNSFWWTYDNIALKLENYSYKDNYSYEEKYLHSDNGEKSQEYNYIVAGKMAQNISDSNTMYEYHNDIIHMLGYIDVNIVGGNGIKNCLDIQIYDNSGNFKCSTRDSVYLLVKFVGEDVTRFYACNHISEKYDVKTIENMLDDIEYYKHPKLYLKGTEFEFCIEGVTDKDKLSEEGYEYLNEADIDGLTYERSFILNTYQREQGAKTVEEATCTGNFKGQDMTVRLIATANFWYDYGKSLIFIYSVLLLLAIIIAFMISYRKYISMTLQYENDLYRRNITNAMAHDLKSPLMAVSGYVQNILENTKPKKNEYYLTSIQSTVDYMDKMIGNILDLSKSESMTKESDMEMVDMRKLILDCAEKYAGLMEKGKLTFTVSGELRIWCDRVMMNQAIDNIVGNAVKYAVCDSKISVELRESGMTFKNQYAGRIEVAADKLTEPFVKGDNAREGQTGSGIGLSIVDNVFRLYGYRVMIVINEGEFNLSAVRRN